MLNDKNYVVSLKRIEICDLMLACSAIEYRIPESDKASRVKWSRLHDELKRQLAILDALNAGKEED